MTQEQLEKIIAIIEKDATGHGYLFPTPDTACVLGGLLEAVSPNARERYIPIVSEFAAFPVSQDIKTLKEEYGLRYEDITKLYMVNDSIKEINRRRRRLIEEVQSIALTSLKETSNGHR